MIIRIRHNQSHIILGEHGEVLDNHKSVIGSRVPVLMGSGAVEHFNFRGFIPRPVEPSQYVKVLDIVAYGRANDLFTGPMIDVPRDSYCVGIFKNESVWLLVESDSLLIRALTPQLTRPKAPVVNIATYRSNRHRRS